jgi:hypothetical protein
MCCSRPGRYDGLSWYEGQQARPATALGRYSRCGPEISTVFSERHQTTEFLGLKSSLTKSYLLCERGRSGRPTTKVALKTGNKGTFSDLARLCILERISRTASAMTAD